MAITVNGIEITDQDMERELPHHERAESPLKSALHALVMRELLMQQAARMGLSDGGMNEPNEVRDDALINKVLESEVCVPEATEQECMTYYRNHLEHFRSGDLVEASHILFQVTEATPLDLLRDKAGQVLQDVLAEPERFAEFAAQFSNCSSSEQGGNLGQLTRGQTVPEFEAAIFSLQQGEIGRRLVETRFGLHIVRVARRAEGRQMPFEMAQEKIAEYLNEGVRRRAVSQYLQILAGQAEIHGIELGGAQTPLVQ